MSQLHKIYVRLIASLLWANERLFFYPALASFYRKQLSGSPVILDVGANRGQSIRFFRRLFPNAIIHAFEPNRHLFAILKNQFANPKTFIYDIGVSDCLGEKVFFENVLDETSSLELVDSQSSYLEMKSRVLLTKPDKLIAKQYPVKVTTLHHFIQTHQPGLIDLLKIDVEGHEPAVLHGLEHSLQSHPIRFIQLEEHQDDQYKSAALRCGEILTQQGFFEIWRRKHGFGNFSEVVYCKAEGVIEKKNKECNG